MNEPTDLPHRSVLQRYRSFIVGLVLVAVAVLVVVATSGNQPTDEGVTSTVTQAPAQESSQTSPTEPASGQTSTVAPATTPGTTEPDTGLEPTDPSEPSTTVTSGLQPSGVEADLEAVLDSLTTGLDEEAIGRLVRSGDLRVAWVLADLMRFIHPELSGLSDAFTLLTGVELGSNPWKEATNKLIEWDTPAPPGFGEWKGRVYTLIDSRWTPFFADPDSLIDWRHVTWGGVFIDDRPISVAEQPCPLGCIPALNDPPLEPASESDYYPDDAYVFAVTVNGEAVAFPKNLMEVHEMVNITIGGRRLGIPYCTLCGSAQAYFTDEIPESARALMAGAETFELRTSGLLSRSNKMMYEYHTFSMIDTFTGQAVSGPLRAAGVQLPQTTVLASRWDEWKAANPHSYIVVEDGGLGRTYPDDPLRGRDDDGPIFPTGDVDGRLPVQEKVLGVLWQDGSTSTAVAFPVVASHEILQGGGSVEHGGITVRRDGGGLRAWDPDGEEIPAHEAFWFAWSQFHPGTELWTPAGN